jgi:chaperone modulatory protein CbpM
MPIEYLTSMDEFCNKHNIEISFISSLQQTGLIAITAIKEKKLIDSDQIHKPEKFIRLYYELNISLGGLETIAHLLLHINAMHDEMTTLKNRLDLYETNE